jgi:L-ascorbate metabolism protein UlaG (beta-lactamase superfamily)
MGDMGMQIRLLRHATTVIQYEGNRFLLDPVFGARGCMPPIQNSPKMRPNPLTELPLSTHELGELLSGISAVLVTHTHCDHFDTAAAETIPKELPLICQPQDEAKLTGLGFQKVIPLNSKMDYNETILLRTGGQHGSPLMSQRLGPVSGFVLGGKDEPKTYIAGDTIWCTEVLQALSEHQPKVILLFAGAAQYISGGRITMSITDIDHVAKASPSAKIVVVHMEAFNHCLLTRAALREFIQRNHLSHRVFVPEDGEEIQIF